MKPICFLTIWVPAPARQIQVLQRYLAIHRTGRPRRSTPRNQTTTLQNDVKTYAGLGTTLQTSKQNSRYMKTIPGLDADSPRPRNESKRPQSASLFLLFYFKVVVYTFDKYFGLWFHSPVEGPLIVTGVVHPPAIIRSSSCIIVAKYQH